MKGLTLLEALLSLAILSIVVSTTLLALNNVSLTSSTVQTHLNYSIARNQLVALIWQENTLSPTLMGSQNPNMACYLNQAEVSLASRTCAGKNGDLAIYDIKGALIYDSNDPSAGIGVDGQFCTDFVAAPGTPNPRCPLHARLTWSAACGDANCVNPPIQIQGRFSFNGLKGQHPPMMKSLDFNSFRMPNYCPPQVLGGILTAVGNAAITPPAQVASTDVGKVFSTGIGQFSEFFLPCREVTILYQEDMDSNPLGPLTAGDSENRSRVCLTNEDVGGGCTFEIVRTRSGGTNTLQLKYSGGTLYTTPGYLAISSSSVFTIKIRANLTLFQVDGRTYFIWPNKIDYPVRLQFIPASKSYSPTGFFTITPTVTDL